MVRFHPEAATLGRLVARGWTGRIPALRVELARYKPDKADHPRRRGADDQVEVRRAQGDTPKGGDPEGERPLPSRGQTMSTNVVGVGCKARIFKSALT